ncbi:MAG: hypothetical protein IKS45_01960, partial [Thermoguttaceae bacterium]|nr:hypothetical protein [Thermoguttaceae bacterium]
MSTSSQKTAESFDLYQALKQAPEGSHIKIPAGDYLLKEPLEINRNVCISGETGDPADVTIVSQRGAAVVVTAPSARICSVTIANQNADEQENSNDFLRSSVVVILSGETEIFNCVITGKGDG